MGSLVKQLQKKQNKKKYKEHKKMFLDERKWQEYCKNIGYDNVENNLIGRKFLHFKDWLKNKETFINELENVNKEDVAIDDAVDLEWKDE